MVIYLILKLYLQNTITCRITFLKRKIMNKYDSTKIFKKYTLKYLIKNINNINNQYLEAFKFLLDIDDKFKANLLTLLKETQKTN